MVWYGMVEVCEGAPVAVSGWVLTDRHDLAPCAANGLHRGTISVSKSIWYGMVEVCEGAPVAVSGWVLTDRHDLAPCNRCIVLVSNGLN